MIFGFPFGPVQTNDRIIIFVCVCVQLLSTPTHTAMVKPANTSGMCYCVHIKCTHDLFRFLCCRPRTRQKRSTFHEENKRESERSENMAHNFYQSNTA